MAGIHLDSYREAPIRPSYLVIGGFFIVYLFYRLIAGSQKKLPISLTTNQTPPYVGLPQNLPWLFPTLRCAIRFVSDGRSWVQEGYRRYTERGEPFVVKSFEGDITIMPPDAYNELKTYGDDKITDMNNELLMVHYTLGSGIADNPYHKKVIAKDLTSKLNQITPDIWDELSLATADTFGQKCSAPDAEGWQKISIYKALLDVVARTSNKIFVGAPLCREKEYLHANIDAATMIIPLAAMLRALPKFLHPICGPVFSYPVHRRFKLIYKYLKPIIEERLQQLQAGCPKSEEPDDLLQWMIRASLPYGKVEANSWSLCVRMVTSNFAAIHTTSLAATGIFYDLAYVASKTKPGQQSIIDQLREEIKGTLVDETGKVCVMNGTRPLQRLPKLDAFIKETARIHGVGPIAVARKVTAKEGLVIRGQHFPQGSKFAFAGDNWHQSENNYSNAGEHDYTRYESDSHVEFLKNKGKTSPEKSDSESDTKADNCKSKKMDRYITSVSEDFLVFGGLKHQCPGRFFSNNELRILISYFLLNYDIKPMSKRPDDIFLGFTRIPDMDAEIEIRKL